nr:UDP-N-acetylglucosamine 2-epimerase (non-hydrolyzing) [Telmatospirillum sp.]
MKLVVCIGTRPEAIKMFPVVHALEADGRFNVEVWATAQHRGMLDQVLRVAGITPTVDLDLMRAGQTLTDITTGVIARFGEMLETRQPDRVIVQGDTTTAFAASLAAFYRKIPVGHVEAGLRTGNIHSPWPEEANRKLVAVLADLHFAPTKRAFDALRAESVPADRIHLTGNTVVDAFLSIKARLPQFHEATAEIAQRLPPLGSNQRIILLTSHRRENFAGGMERIATAAARLAMRDDVFIVFPVHPNPHVQDVMNARLAGHPRIALIPPLDYVPFIYLLTRCHLVLTDSGGVQEEAPSIGKPVLVMRDTTERPEGVEAGTAILVGTDTDRIVREASRLLDDEAAYMRMSRAHNPFGDGHAAERIVEHIASAHMAKPSIRAVS